MTGDMREFIDQFRNFKQKQITVYRCIDGEYNPTYDKIQFFAVNKDYPPAFGKDCYEFKLDLANAIVMDLKNWNNIYTEKTGRKGNIYNRVQGLFTIGSMAIESKYRDELKLFKKELGVNLTNEFIRTFENADAIYGEDAGYPDQYVYAVKNPHIIEGPL